MSTSTKVGNAVRRNRIKRVLREAFWAVADDLPQNYDYVLIARKPANEWVEEAGLAKISAELLRLGTRLTKREAAKR